MRGREREVYVYHHLGVCGVWRRENIFREAFLCGRACAMARISFWSSLFVGGERKAGRLHADLLMASTESASTGAVRAFDDVISFNLLDSSFNHQ